MNERLKEIRKYLQMSQRAFCGKMGMTQSTYASLEIGNRDLKDAYIKLVCKTYNVSEDWLRSGTGEMFVSEPSKELEELLNVFDTLSPELQKYIVRQAKELQGLQGKKILE